MLPHDRWAISENIRHILKDTFRLEKRFDRSYLIRAQVQGGSGRIESIRRPTSSCPFYQTVPKLQEQSIKTLPR
jgi:hypothetical protein